MPGSETSQMMFDIETVGTDANSMITVAGNLVGDNAVIHYVDPEDSNMDMDFLDNIHDHLPDALSGLSINIVGCTTETELLNQLVYTIQEEANTSDTSTTELVGFYSNEFDIPMFRTRCILNDVDWMNTSVESLDICNTFDYKFNTDEFDISGLNKTPLKKFANEIGVELEGDEYKSEIVEAINEHGYSDEDMEQFLDEMGLDRPTSTVSTLDGIFEMLCAETLDDPFEDSKEAIEAFKQGNITDVIIHNLIDLYMTREIYSHAEDYVPNTELRTRSI